MLINYIDDNTVIEFPNDIAAMVVAHPLIRDKDLLSIEPYSIYCHVYTALHMFDDELSFDKRLSSIKEYFSNTKTTKRLKFDGVNFIECNTMQQEDRIKLAKDAIELLDNGTLLNFISEM